MPTELKKEYGPRKLCAGRCGKKRATSTKAHPVGGFFRVLTSGYLAARCRDCERVDERERWHTRSAASRGNA